MLSLQNKLHSIASISIIASLGTKKKKRKVKPVQLGVFNNETLITLAVHLYTGALISGPLIENSAGYRQNFLPPRSAAPSGRAPNNSLRFRFHEGAIIQVKFFIRASFNAAVVAEYRRIVRVLVPINWSYIINANWRESRSYHSLTIIFELPSKQLCWWMCVEYTCTQPDQAICLLHCILADGHHISWLARPAHRRRNSSWTIKINYPTNYNTNDREVR